MQRIRLGRTGLMVSRTSFGALPLQRTEQQEAVRILQRAVDAGINFFDTARAYSNSEEKIGLALAGRRDQVILATKSWATTRDGVLKDLAVSLRNLRTDYVDLLQLHNPRELPLLDDPESSYAGLLEAKKKGMVRFFGITNHSRTQAAKAIAQEAYDTLQFPLCMISDEADWALAEACRAVDMGVIAMKALSGGLITNVRAAFAFLRQFDNIVPIWGIQHMHELEDFLEMEATPPAYDAELRATVEADRRELAGAFCRACGYCLPCPAEIPIPMAARMGLCLKRMPFEQFLSEDWREKMGRIDDCIDCGQCAERCPYGLTPRALLQKMKLEYDEFVRKHEA